MSYKISKLSYSAPKPSLILNIDTDLEITDICYVDKIGFLLLLPEHHCVGKISDGKIDIPWIGQLNQGGIKDGSLAKLDHPSSMCYLKDQDLCFIIESGGSRIRKIQLWNKHAVALLGENSYGRLSSFFVNVDDIGALKTDCGVDIRGNIYWVVDGINRCFKYDVNMGDIECYAGDGHSGFSVSNNLHSCRLNNPRGIFVDEKAIYLSDAKNYCIRKVTDGMISIVTGNPLKNAIYPTKIRGCKNTLYFINGNEIKYSVNNDVGVLYESEGIISIDADDKKNLFILEKT